MTTTSTEKYIDNLIIALQLHSVPGKKIGQVVAEVEAHVAESGEDPADAFGKPSDYAKTWARNTPRPAHWSERVRSAVCIAACAAGGWFLGIGVIRTFTDERVLGQHSLLSVALGVVLLVCGLAAVRKNVVIDPRTGLEPRRVTKVARHGFLISGAAVLLFVALAVLVGVTAN